MMNKFSALLLGLLISNVALADGVSSIKDFFNDTKSMRADFKQVIKDNQGRKVQEVEGGMQLKRPNMFRWDYKSRIFH